MQRSSRKMADVTDKLLLLAHAEATPSTLLTHRVDLAAVVSSVLEETIVLAQRDIDLGPTSANGSTSRAATAC